MKNKIGRPQLEDKRNKHLKVYLNSKEKEELEKLLSKSIYNNSSEMIRDVVFNKRFKVISIDEKSNQEKAILITQIKRLGVNFNTLIKMLNSKKLNYFTNDDIKIIKKELINIGEFLKKIK